MTSTPPARNEKRWQATSFAAFAAIVQAPRRHQSPPWIVAVDGRSAAGKTTLTDRLAASTLNCAIVHTDDLAWHEPLFAWGHLLRAGVLAPLRDRARVAFTPPAWTQYGRTGAIVVPAGLDMVIVEGVGSSQRPVSDLIDIAIWIQSDEVETRRRGLARDIASGVNGSESETIAFWDEWHAAEVAFLANDRPWDRADFIVCGTPGADTGVDEVLVAH